MTSGPLPVIAVTTQGRPQVSVAAIGRPVVASVVLPGQQGAEGGIGPVGPPGVTTGFGQILYSHAETGQGITLAANARTQLTFSPDSILSQDYLNPPFSGHVFWNGSKILGRAFADILLIQVNLQVVPAVEGGTLLIDLDVDSNLGPIVSDSEDLGPDATLTRRISGKLVAQTVAGFMTNGCKIYLTSSVPVRVVRESVFIIPLSTYAGA